MRFDEIFNEKFDINHSEKNKHYDYRHKLMCDRGYKDCKKCRSFNRIFQLSPINNGYSEIFHNKKIVGINYDDVSIAVINGVLYTHYQDSYFTFENVPKLYLDRVLFLANLEHSYKAYNPKWIGKELNMCRYNFYAEWTACSNLRFRCIYECYTSDGTNNHKEEHIVCKEHMNFSRPNL